MLRANTSTYIQRALSQWPKDSLRQDISFQRVIGSRFKQEFTSPSTSSSFQTNIRKPDRYEVAADNLRDVEQANALYSLLENRYSKKYRLSEQITKPQSNPLYYENLLQEIREAPHRSFWQRALKRWKGFLRFA